MFRLPFLSVMLCLMLPATLSIAQTAGKVAESDELAGDWLTYKGLFRISFRKLGPEHFRVEFQTGRGNPMETETNAHITDVTRTGPHAYTFSVRDYVSNVVKGAPIGGCVWIFRVDGNVLHASIRTPQHGKSPVTQQRDYERAVAAPPTSRTNIGSLRAVQRNGKWWLDDSSGHYAAGPFDDLHPLDDQQYAAKSGGKWRIYDKGGHLASVFTWDGIKSTPNGLTGQANGKWQPIEKNGHPKAH